MRGCKAGDGYQLKVEKRKGRVVWCDVALPNLSLQFPSQSHRPAKMRCKENRIEPQDGWAGESKQSKPKQNKTKLHQHTAEVQYKTYQP